MVAAGPSCRALLLGFVALAAAGRGQADTIVDLSWGDLLPEDTQPLPERLQGIVQHEGASLAAGQPVSSGVRREWNGQTVRLSGFIVPLEHKGAGVTVFILVPYVGACIHVPPPPANQLVLVTAPEPYDSAGLFEAVTVTGMFGTASSSTQLADIGYALSADEIRPYRR